MGFEVSWFICWIKVEGIWRSSADNATMVASKGAAIHAAIHCANSLASTSHL